MFGMCGIVSLGVTIATIGSALVEAELEAIQSWRTQWFLSHILPKLRHNQTSHHSDHPSSSEEVSNPTKFSIISLSIDILPRVLPSIILLFLTGCLLGRIEGWSIIDSLYYSIISAVTLGFGDISPRTPRGRLAAVLLLPLAVASAGEVLGTISQWWLSRRRELRKDQLQLRPLDMAYLRELDLDDDGYVSRYEYVAFLLQAMDLVDKDLLTRLNVQFEKLDVNNDGLLSIEDLIAIAGKSGSHTNSTYK
jgi:Ion channel/EF hand